MKNAFSTLIKVFFWSFLVLCLLFAEDNNEQAFWADMPYNDDYLSPNYGDFMQKPSYDDVRSLALMGDDYVVAGTSCGVVIWNIKEGTNQIVPIEKDWTPENVKKEYFTSGETPQPRTEEGKKYFQRWTKNAIKNIYVLADGRIWTDTFNGVAIFNDKELQYIFNSDEDAITDQYETVLMNKTLWKNWLVVKNGYIFYRHKPEGYTALREIGRQFDGKQWQSVFVDDKQDSMLYDWYLDRDGMVWAKVWPELLRFDGSKWEKMKPRGPISFYQTSNGNIWIGCMDGVANFSSNTYKWYANVGYTSEIIETKDGKLWFFGKGCATSWDGKEWKSISFRSPYEEESVNKAFYTSDNSIWLSGILGGLLRFDGEQINTVPEGRGIRVKSYLQTSNGDIWLILGDGLAVIKGNEIDMLKDKEMPGKYLCRQVIQGKDGSIWVASQKGLWQLKDGNWKRFSISKAIPKTPTSLFEQYMQNLAARAPLGNYDKIKDMKEQELSNFLTKRPLNSPGEFVVAYLLLEKINKKVAVEVCSEGLQRVLNGQMNGFSSSEGQMWIGLCGRDFMPHLVKLLETTKDEQILFMGTTYIPICLTKEDCDVIANLIQHKNLQDSLRAGLSLAKALFHNKDIRGVEYLVALLKAEGKDSARIREDAFITLSSLASISNAVPTKSDNALWSAWLKKNRETIKLSAIDLGETEENIALFRRLSKTFMDFCHQKAE
jgi:hypothetical protein